jgi:TPR repeat protein
MKTLGDGVIYKQEVKPMDSQQPLPYQQPEGGSMEVEPREWTLQPGHRLHCDAAFKLGTWHLTAKEIDKALKWYERAATAGHAAAQYNLGLLYLKGEDVPWDGFKGMAWISKAANAGDVKAQALLHRLRWGPSKVGTRQAPRA